MQRIGVVSDTHIPVKVSHLPPRIFECFMGVDRIIHAGDILRLDVLDELSAIAPVIAVRGNMDRTIPPSRLNMSETFMVEDALIGLIHGHGSGTALDTARRAFGAKEVNCVVFGHSHRAFNKYMNGVLYFNPGSPTDYSRSHNYYDCPTVGILTVTEGSVKGEIINLGELGNS